MLCGVFLGPPRNGGKLRGRRNSTPRDKSRDAPPRPRELVISRTPRGPTPLRTSVQSRASTVVQTLFALLRPGRGAGLARPARRAGAGEERVQRRHLRQGVTGQWRRYQHHW